MNALAPTAFDVTPGAARRIVEVMRTEAAGAALRISVDGGGCSGFQYKFGIETDRQPDDIIIERDGATVLLDETSLQFMSGSVLDYVDDLVGQAFKITNPKATSSCGCGTSFSV
jgi:iron-sulfur cluster assembly accessory protein